MFSADLARRMAVELIGTFALVFAVVCTTIGQQPNAALCVGATLMAAVYFGGHISGAHYNPAVTIAVWLRGKLPAADVVPYFVAQVLGGVIAAWLGRYIFNFKPSGSPTAIHDWRAIGSIFTAELIITFILASVVLNVATSKATEERGFYGLAIGFTVLAGALAVGNISGGFFNPAVAIGVATAGLFSWVNVWIYLVVGALAGVLAAGFFRLINPEEFIKDEVPADAEFAGARTVE